MISEKKLITSTEAQLTWAEPIPLIHEYERSLPYPVQSLPNIIQDAVIAYHQYGKQPLSLIACSALSTISLACQSLANVARDRLLISPVSLYFLIIALQNLSLCLTAFWDGNPFLSYRKTSKNVNVTNRRLTVSLMLQPLILQQMLSKSEGVNRQSGFMARSLMAFPESSMGERFYQEPPESQTALSNFHQRLINCLNQSLIFRQTWLPRNTNLALF